MQKADSKTGEIHKPKKWNLQPKSSQVKTSMSQA